MSGDEIDDRLSKRFSDEDDNTGDQGQSDTHSESSSKSKTSQKSQNAQNIKKEWNVRSFYLDDDLERELTTAFKRLDLELAETDTDINLKKTRHFYPMIVSLGLDKLEELEVTEVTEQLEK